ncbi:MAG: hypothetical protein QME66_09080, partial [Candidatus Eisenbacteria bacterium]|nr:hypothetical protein [Candidatus Eisenbacteria bacterium]
MHDCADFPPRVLTGWIPANAEERLLREPGVESIFRTEIPLEVLNFADAPEKAGLNFFDSFLARERYGVAPKNISEEETNSRPILDDARPHPEPDWPAIRKNLEKMPSLSPLSEQCNSDDMMGTVAVTLFFVESDGTRDPNTYSWSTAAYQQTVNRAAQGLNWWVGQASNYGRALTFMIINYPPTDSRCQTGYEPIIHASWEAGYGGCTSCGLCSHGVEIRNCEYCNHQSVNCMMKNNSWTLCAYTPGHVGWLSTPLAKYYRHSIADSSGNNNGMADPGETVSMSVVIKNYGTAISSVAATLSTADSAIVVQSSYAQFSNLNTGETGTSLTPYSFHVADWALKGRIASFDLHITAAGYETTSTFQIGIGFPTVLLVDDDSGASYEIFYQDALSAVGIPARVWNRKAAGTPPFSEMRWYKAVIWFTSYDVSFTLDGNDERAQEQYLNNGGSLLLSSQDYLAERFEYFAANCLHVSAVEFDTWSFLEGGIDGDPISDGLSLSMSYPFPNYSDDITPDSKSAPVFINSRGHPGALRFPATGTAPYKLVFLAFPFEAISNGTYPNNRTEVMKRIMSWLLQAQDFQPPALSVLSPDGGEVGASVVSRKFVVYVFAPGHDTFIGASRPS